MNMQQPPLGTPHLILGNSLVRCLQNLRTSGITTVMAFGGATVSVGGVDEPMQNRGHCDSNSLKRV